MNNEGVAFGDIFKIISEGNTAIIHYSLSIIHSCVSTINGNWHRRREVIAGVSGYESGSRGAVRMLWASLAISSGAI